jgi:7,8-dihydropterin-6-yl-methyl-4-(beta-D-ribofuranosyl)aminobenzene 5'-phosphate synthase
MDEQYLGSRGRRRLLGAGSAATLGMLAGGILGKSRIASAQALTGPVPEVDRLAVRVVTDSYLHLFERSARVGDVEVQRVGQILPKDSSNPRVLLNEWGLSLHLESQRGAENRQVLVDFGWSPQALLHNMDILRVDPARLDALVLSHGHYDHFGGMVGFLQANRGKLKQGLPFYLGGEECFCTREAGIGDASGNFGALDRKAIDDAGLRILFAERPTVVGDHGFTTGFIPRATFERVLSPTRMKPGVQDGVGCFPDRLAEEKRNVAIVPDDFQHEQATCYNVRGKGLVVMTSCGHRGVANSVRGAMKVSGVNKVHAVLGGFHLAPHAPEYQRDTALALKELNPDFVIPMHCSGETFIAIAMQELGPKVIRSSTGTRFVFGA